MSKIDFCNDFAMDESDASLTVKQDCISLHFIINLIFLFSKKKKKLMLLVQGHKSMVTWNQHSNLGVSEKPCLFHVLRAPRPKE